MSVKPPEGLSASVFLFNKSAKFSVFRRDTEKCESSAETLTKFPRG